MCVLFWCVGGAVMSKYHIWLVFLTNILSWHIPYINILPKMVIIGTGSNIKDSTSCHLLCVFFFWHQMILGKHLYIFPSVGYVSMWLSLEYLLCSLPSSFPLPVSLLVSWPLFNSVPDYLSASLFCLPLLHTCIVPAYTMTFLWMFSQWKWFFFYFIVGILMSPQGICRSNQRWQRKCNPGVRKLERMHQCLFIVWKRHWPTLLPQAAG